MSVVEWTEGQLAGAVSEPVSLRDALRTIGVTSFSLQRYFHYIGQ